MPELPEVETLRRGLDRLVRDRCITGATVVNAKLLKGQPEAEFLERVLGRKIASVNRRGKYLLIPMSQAKSEFTSGDIPAPVTLCIHLKMRGQLRIEPAATVPGPYLCIRLYLEDGIDSGKADEELRFYDMWTWGEMRALRDSELETMTSLPEMGPEPLETSWNAGALGQKLAGRRGPIKPLLLDQRTVAGVGNIYADESLFRAGIDPRRQACTLTDDEVERLAHQIRSVLTEAIDGGGTLSEEFVDLGGEAGRYTPRVYNRGGLPCDICSSPLTRIKLGGRGTVFCSQCQPA